ncbi:hypothetical protein [Paraburkholderia sp. J8-2]|uniref:hypothetical protein n=1 Tax=Paraburkholderia sp. J8-2 TaxID=2805440 RepID=UPI002AB714A1|nr:hypothetical protein [Paraburkholderia sp. J8-2]
MLSCVQPLDRHESTVSVFAHPIRLAEQKLRRAPHLSALSFHQGPSKGKKEKFMSRNPFFQAVRRGTFAGQPAGKLVNWLAKYIQVLFPEDGVEWWSDNQFARLADGYRADTELPGAAAIHHFACYVRTGNESPIIEVNIVPKDGAPRSLTTVKLFARREVCWKMCDAIALALDSIFSWEEVPLIVEMFEKLPKRHSWSIESCLAESVVCEKTPNSFTVRTETGTPIDAVKFDDKQPETARYAVAAVEHDWLKVLGICSVDVKQVEATLL